MALRFVPGAIVALVVALFAAIVTGCRNEQPQQTTASDAGSGEPRIVSISPALTRMVVDLSLGEHIVGRTPWCSAVDESVPVVGDLNDINYEMLTRLEPTHVFTQPAQGAVPEALTRLADEHKWKLIQAHIDSVMDIRQSLDSIAGTIGIETENQESPAGQRLADLRSQLDQLLIERDWPSVIGHGGVLLLYQVDPPSVFGKGTYLDDILTHLGVANATEARGWAQLTLEDVTRLNPAAILFIQPGALEGLNVIEAIGPVADLDIAAMREDRVAVIRHKDALLPSTSVIEVAAEVRAALDGWRQ